MSLFDALKKAGRPAAGAADALDACILLDGIGDLDAAVASRDKLMVLVYASWCGFSQAFLPHFLAQAAAGEPCYARMISENDDPVVERYQVEVFPTVLFFEKGRLAHRLDGVFHRGLTRGQLQDFARRCQVR